MKLLAIDPGPAESAYLVLRDERPLSWGKIPSDELLENIRAGVFDDCDHLAIEMVESFGMAVGKEVFQTVFNTGRMVEGWYGKPWTAVYRKEVKLHLCQSMRAKDANIRQVLIDKFGGSAAIGKKRNPGPLHGLSGDCWSALAVAITFMETRKELANV